MLGWDTKASKLIHCFLFGSIIVASTAVFAHGSERGLVLLLPTGYYMAGSALAVAASFLLLSVVPAHWIFAMNRPGPALFSISRRSSHVVSMVSFLLVAVLVTAGFTGSTDPLDNPLPLTVWTLWWVGFTIIQGAFGNLWPACNPWTGPLLLIRKLTGLPHSLVKLPASLGYAPAIVVFFGFVWFELVYLAPEDPSRLAVAVLVYWLYTLAAMMLFGDEAWFNRGEPFAIFFKLIGCCSPFMQEPVDTGTTRVRLSWPGTAFTQLPPLPVSGVLFVLLTLSSVSFDGLLKTFTWISMIGINPLEYPGRSAVTTSNTLGLVIGFLTVTIIYYGCVWGGCLLSRVPEKMPELAGRLVYSIIPISLVFHFAHYLTLMLVNGQYAWISWNDPMQLDWSLLGADNWHVTTSMLTHIEPVRIIWITQTVAIAAGHILGIIVAHRLVMDTFNDNREATFSQIPLAILMVLYTLFGLWLLSTPSIG